MKTSGPAPELEASPPPRRGDGAARVAGPNPYVGPCPFKRGETLYGRDDEITDLYYLWNAERIVLLYSPSGAGKSSLVQAGLVPRLKGGYDVWGLTRVNQEPPGPAGGVSGRRRGDPAVNRYVLSAVQGFEQGVPVRLRRPAEELARLTLVEYFQTRPRRRSAPKSIALIFDQFEEVLTVDPLAVAAKQEFFVQLGKLLQNPQVWALFVLREDYLAPLDPYVGKVPTQMRNRFRIDMLGLGSAREAIVNPARAGGREFPAAGRLLQDLATRKVQQADGSFREQAGHHVEPVQLQVVCRRLWDAMPAEELSIDAEDLAQFGDVTEALAGYYADSVARISGGNEVRERAIRDWFDEALITAGIRGQVLKGVEESGGLDQALVVRLLDTHLVRPEERAGATWYELAHDRLIVPVRENNASWRAEHLSEVQRRAALWQRQGHPPGLLMQGDEMAAAERWITGSVPATEVELRFLAESKEALAIAERESRQTLWIKRLAVAAIIVGALAVFASVFAAIQMAEAGRQRDEVLKEREDAAREGLEQAIRLLQVEQDREAAKSALEAVSKAAEGARDDAPASRRPVAVERDSAGDETRAGDHPTISERLRRVAEAEALAVAATRMTGASSHELAAVLAVAAYRLHRRFGGEAESSEVYNALRLAVQRLGADRRVMRGHRQLTPDHRAAVRSLAVAPDGRTLAAGSGGEDGELRLIDLDQPDGTAEVVGRVGDGLCALAWSGDGRRLASGSFTGRVLIWDAARLRSGPRVFRELAGPVDALAFQPGREVPPEGDKWQGAGWLAVATGSGTSDPHGGIWLLSLGGSGQTDVLLRPPAGGPAGETDQAAGRPRQRHALAWNSDGSSLAAAGHGGGVAIWQVAQPQAEPRLVGRGLDVSSVAWSGDGRLLAAGTAAGSIAIWQPARPGALPLRLLDHTARIDVVQFHPRHRFLVSGSVDGSLRLWDVERPADPSLVLEKPESPAWAVAFSRDGERLISASGDHTIRLLPSSSEVLAAEVCQIVSRDLTRAEWRQHLPAEVGYEPVCLD